MHTELGQVLFINNDKMIDQCSLTSQDIYPFLVVLNLGLRRPTLPIGPKLRDER